MSWTLILTLSAFGLVMGIATVFVIPYERDDFSADEVTR